MLLIKVDGLAPDTNYIPQIRNKAHQKPDIKYNIARGYFFMNECIIVHDTGSGIECQP